jgi:hypothetical protein
MLTKWAVMGCDPMLNTIQCGASMFGLTGLQYSFYTASELSLAALAFCQQ